MTIVGTSPIVKDARLKVTGQAIYTQDVNIPGMLHGKILRSPLAHAKIISIDTAEAELLPGVRAVVTHKDCRPDGMNSYWSPPRLMFAVDKVRFVGDPVAAVAADTVEIAEEAVKLIKVEYQELPLVLDPIEALKPDAPQIYEAGNSFTMAQGMATSGTPCFAATKGDIEQGLKEADISADFIISTPIITNHSPETDTTVAQWFGEQLTVWSSSQGGFTLHSILSMVFGIRETDIHLISNYSGAGHGANLKECSMRACITALLSRKAKMPVKISYTKREVFSCMSMPDKAKIRVRVGAKDDGSLTALEILQYHDIGGYGETHAVYSGFAQSSLVDFYKCPNVKFVLYTCMTNNGVGGYFRSYGPEMTCWAIEMGIERVLGKLGIDAGKFKLKNHLQPGDKTHDDTLLTESSVFDIDFTAAMNGIGWDTKWHAPGKGETYEGSKKRGVGLACATKHHTKNDKSVELKISRDGSIQFNSFPGNFGQGIGSSLSVLLAEALGAKYEDINTVILGDSDISPFTTCSFGSSTLFYGGHAILQAAQEARAILFERAANILGVKAEDLESKDSVISLKADPTKKVTFKDALQKPYVFDIVISNHVYGPAVQTNTGGRGGGIFPSGALAVEVEVDTETGQVTVLEACSSHNLGKAIHRKVAEGQVSGGALLNIPRAHRLFIPIDPVTGTPLVTSDDGYVWATMVDDVMPIVNITEVPEPLGPMGAAPIGEKSVAGTSAAVMSAVFNAIGVWIDDKPLTPDKVLKALGKV